MKNLAFVCLLFVSIDALAGYSAPSRSGGSRSFSAPSRSYSAPSRSYSAPARPSTPSRSYTAPARPAAPARSYTAPARPAAPASPAPSRASEGSVVNHTIVQQSGGGSGFGFWHFLALNSLFNRGGSNQDPPGMSCSGGGCSRRTCVPLAGPPQGTY